MDLDGWWYWLGNKWFKDYEYPLNWEYKLTVIFNEYSGALAGKGGKWTEKNLDKYLKSPADYAPGKFKLWLRIFQIEKTTDIECYVRMFGSIYSHNFLSQRNKFKMWKLTILFIKIGNAMAFAGLANAKDRGDIIAYLKSQSWVE